MTQEKRLVAVEKQIKELTSLLGRTVDGCLGLVAAVTQMAAQIEQQQNPLSLQLAELPPPSSPYPRVPSEEKATLLDQQSSDVTVQSVKSSQ